jgi:tetratricopeptide (TPR) repeat protein
VLGKLGRYEEAFQAIDKALELNPDNYGVWKNKGDVLKELGRYEEALQAIDKALELSPAHYDAWDMKKTVLDRLLDRQKEAQIVYKKRQNLFSDTLKKLFLKT